MFPNQLFLNVSIVLGIIFGKKVNHPGIKANPYLLNAWNIYKNGGLKRASDELAQNVGKEIVKDIKVIFK
ncbi:Uncharacterised protein [Campylobacter hyointestinalis subsp. hyointestinalis]|uniref:Uncharacterized protein n=1 Tax=Campylobacter hyointestinalis subsp. hyointestinalis TaxID=91352 RepID=A0A0S4SYH8_CAMHY|nr:hypothetical protein [Campylobacter hyointestinalis]RAZ48511.1 hypothetical protein CHL14416_01270 [Campylobacter hyointestinalis subsp. lawsonii]CUU90857.1 Uncharacterised protein [Campylobacter hyointestinalis subsp. hyointestinalis]